ncbi:MAG TPA: pimeloyl-CoA dehydrogenase large subunit [Rhabdaerophilum sp.]|nr:pimeloyl-CoA dehydrogenase large subunit [Rhabdaerophilum sp.]
MDLHFTEEENAFRAEVRAFIDANLSPRVRQRLIEGRKPSRDDLVEWTRTLHAKGWSTPRWPVEYGGTGWSPIKQYIFLEEVLAAPAPEFLSFGVSMVGPVIYTFGNETQKKRFLPRIANLDDWWCQGFSEPGAGSDLASLTMRAVREDDHYRVNGQKTWTTLGQYANWIFCLVRTNPEAKKQEGISFLLIDMKTPGITVRPIITVDGAHEVNEVFFDDVEVPVENLVGEENKGWDYAKFLLSNERIGIARIGVSKARLRRLRELASLPGVDGSCAIDRPRFRDRLIETEIALKALEITQLRVLSDEAKGLNKGKPNPASSVLKIRGSELQQATTELLMDVVGAYALPFADPHNPRNEPPVGPDWADAAAPLYFNMRKVSIYGGSNEIQKNIIAKAILGL